MIEQPQWVWFLEAVILIFLVFAGLRYGWIRSPYQRDTSSRSYSHDSVKYTPYDPYNQLESNNKDKVIEMRMK